MQPAIWKAPIELSKQEEQVLENRSKIHRESASPQDQASGKCMRCNAGPGFLNVLRTESFHRW